MSLNIMLAVLIGFNGASRITLSYADEFIFFKFSYVNKLSHQYMIIYN
jgi:hypothetical protein